MQRRINKLVVFFLGNFLVLNIYSLQVTSPFNKLTIKDSIANYSFIVSGHFHGASTNVSTFPASSLLANIDTLNSSGASFIMSLGDMFLDVNEKYLDHYKKSLFDKLKIPLFNAVGNHDVSNGNLYETVFGTTFFLFQRKSELYVILNTEVNDGSIKGEQLEFFKEAIASASSGEIENVFIFSHRPVWAEQIEKYHDLFVGNTRTAFGKNNFSDEILPLLNTISGNKNVFWLSGSMGGGPASFFYDKDANTNITFIQTAIRDVPRDAVLKVSVNDGKVIFSGISFTGEQLKPVEDYDLKFWSKTAAPEESFNFRLLPLLIFQIFSHYYFWIGLFCGVILFLIASIILKKWRKRK